MTTLHVTDRPYLVLEDVGREVTMPPEREVDLNTGAVRMVPGASYLIESLREGPSNPVGRKHRRWVARVRRINSETGRPYPAVMTLRLPSIDTEVDADSCYYVRWMTES